MLRYVGVFEDRGKTIPYKAHILCECVFRFKVNLSFVYGNEKRKEQEKKQYGWLYSWGKCSYWLEYIRNLFSLRIYSIHTCRTFYNFIAFHSFRQIEVFIRSSFVFFFFASTPRFVCDSSFIYFLCVWMSIWLRVLIYSHLSVFLQSEWNKSEKKRIRFTKAFPVVCMGVAISFLRFFLSLGVYLTWDYGEIEPFSEVIRCE